MRNLLTIAAFTVVAILLYVIWGNLNSKLVVIESNTGSYIDTDNDESSTDLTALLEKLTLLEAAQMANTRTITTILQRLDKLEARGCGGANCATKAINRESIYFSHDDSTLTRTEKNKIDNLLKILNDNSFVSLIGHADTSGNSQYNHLLSLRRAAMVKAYIEEQLNTNGIASLPLISITGTGEESVVKATEDDVEDPSNRIVEILVFE